jgi:methylglyoxal synthase
MRTNGDQCVALEIVDDRTDVVTFLVVPLLMDQDFSEVSLC